MSNTKRSVNDSKMEVPYHWSAVILNEWGLEHIAWLNEQELIWNIDYHIVDDDNDAAEYKQYSSENHIRQVHFLFKDQKNATLFILRWI